MRNDLYTIGDLIARFEVPRYTLAYVVEKAGIKSVRKIGNARVWDQAGVEAIERALRRAGRVIPDCEATDDND